MVGWHHQFNGHEFEWTPGPSDGQGGPVCCSPWGHKKLDMTEWLNWTELIYIKLFNVLKDSWFDKQSQSEPPLSVSPNGFHFFHGGPGKRSPYRAQAGVGQPPNKRSVASRAMDKPLQYSKQWLQYQNNISHFFLTTQELSSSHKKIKERKIAPIKVVLNPFLLS